MCIGTYKTPLRKQQKQNKNKKKIIIIYIYILESYTQAC